MRHSVEHPPKNPVQNPSDIRPVDAARLALGGVALIRPQWLLGVTGSDDGIWPRRVTRILGARYVVQSGLSITLGTPWTSKVDGAIDLVHAASTVGLAARFPRHRRLAIVSGALALGFAVADLREKAR